MFVTWKKRLDSKHADPVLRGCIGTFAPRTLSEGLEHYSLQRYSFSTCVGFLLLVVSLVIVY